MADLTVIGHADLISNFTGDLRYLTIPSPAAQVTMAGLKSSRPILVLASLCPYDYTTGRPWPAQDTWQRWMSFRTTVAASPSFRVIHQFSDVTTGAAEPIQLLLHLEGADVIERPDDLGQLAALGCRALALTWNQANQHAGGAMSPVGLTDLGRECLARMADVGLWLDVSHLNETSFWQVLEHYRGPVLASHSNVRELADTPRNLTRRQLHALRERRAWVGVSFALSHLTNQPTSSIDDVLRQLDGLRTDLGEELVGLGTDWGGIVTPPKDLINISQLPNLWAALAARGESDFIPKLRGKNFLDWWGRQEA